MEGVYHTVVTSPGMDFGVSTSYAAGTSAAGATHDDFTNLGLDTTTDVLS
jgi:hypothetical protein